MAMQEPKSNVPGVLAPAPEVPESLGISSRRRVSRALQDGLRFGKYQIIQLIALGGMSEVYEAIHVGLRKHVALKVMRPELAEHAEARRRFVSEGIHAARIRHTNVVDVSDVGIVEELPYLVMELLVGEDLGVLLDRERHLPVADLVDILLPVAFAVAEGHARGVIHRDLKPENVFLHREGRRVIPKVLDFGVSRVLSARRITLNASVFGTPHYMSPEQARGDACDERSDQYSLGVMLYEAVTGRLPRDSTNPLQLLHSVAFETFAPPSAHVELPSAFESVIMRAMDPEPAGRYASMRDLAVAMIPFASESARESWEMELGVVPLPTPRDESGEVLLPVATRYASSPGFLRSSQLGLLGAGATERSSGVEVKVNLKLEPETSAPELDAPDVEAAAALAPDEPVRARTPSAPRVSPAPSVPPAVHADAALPGASESSAVAMGSKAAVQSASALAPRRKNTAWPAAPAAAKSAAPHNVPAAALVPVTVIEPEELPVRAASNGGGRAWKATAVGVVVASGVVAALRFGQGAGDQPSLSRGVGQREHAGQDNASFAIDVHAVPESASLLLDGSQVGTGHYRGSLPRDGVQHELRVEAPGYVSQRFGFRDVAPPADFVLSQAPQQAPQERVEAVASGTLKGAASPRRGLPASGAARLGLGSGKLGSGGGGKERAEGATSLDPFELDDSLATRGSLSAVQPRGAAARGRGRVDEEAAQAPAGPGRNAQPGVAPRVRIVDGAEPRVRLID